MKNAHNISIASILRRYIGPPPQPMSVRKAMALTGKRQAAVYSWLAGRNAIPAHCLFTLMRHLPDEFASELLMTEGFIAQRAAPLESACLLKLNHQLADAAAVTSSVLESGCRKNSDRKRVLASIRKTAAFLPRWQSKAEEAWT